MINFRYHVVSLIGIFLALGIGVLFGSSFIAEGTVRFLEERQKDLSERNRVLSEEIREAESSISALVRFAEESRLHLLRGTLTGRQLVILSFEDSPPEVLEGLEGVAAQTGARLVASIVLSDRFDLASESRRQQVALAMEVGGQPDTDALRAALNERIAEGLAGRDPGAFERLVAAGLATRRAMERAQEQETLGSPETVVVVLAPGPRGESSFAADVVVPLVTVLSERGVITGAGETGTDPLPLLGLLREGGARAVTADGIETPLGHTALFLGLDAATAGNFGHYGTGRGATRLLPDPAAGQ